MRLGTVLLRLDAFDDGHTIYAVGDHDGWRAGSRCVVEGEMTDGDVPERPRGLARFLQVAEARAVLAEMQQRRGGRPLAPDETVRTLIYYATFDAYEPNDS